jgi:hypothetical protein
VPAVLEQLSIGDTGPERTGDHRTNRGDRLEARTQLARLVLLAQRGVERGDLGTDRLDLSNKYHQGCACRHGQALIALVTDIAASSASPSRPLSAMMPSVSVTLRFQTLLRRQRGWSVYAQEQTKRLQA